MGGQRSDRELGLDMTEADEAFEATVAADGAPAPEASDELPGDLGDFEIIRKLGAGGMGVVYLARDPKLDRQVAIKLHAVRAGELGFDRLEREATAMARLSHPNVIHVYEVGKSGDQLFIVMEYMSGGTLRGWLQTERSLGEILDTFAAAGAGLAAAHDAGLVHRDFKPDNVFIAEDGRVCVADFGLARAVGDRGDRLEASSSVSSGSLDSKLTMTGAAVGTPAYMAPEQFSGDADERADQFAFCVALYQALCGTHPFGGSSLVELRDRALAGEFQPPERGRKMPRWLRGILRRGLAGRAADRFADMHELLGAIARGRRRRPLFFAAAAVAAAMALAATGAYALASSDEPDPCGGAASRLAGVWDGAVHADVERAFAAPETDAKRREMFERTRAVLDRYAADWVAARTATCRATRVTGEQSAQLMDLRISCLERRRDELAALTRLFASKPAPEVIATSVEAATHLTDLDRCADAEALLAAYPPPSDPETAETVAALYKRIDDVGALARTGQYKPALPEAISIARAVSGVDYPPLEAEALLLLGQIEKKSAEVGAEKTLQSAAEAAARARDDRRLAQAHVELVRVIGHLAARHDEALAMIPWTRASIARIGDDPLMRSELEMHRGSVLFEKGKNSEALAAYERALGLRREAVGADDPRLGVVYTNLSIVQDELGNRERAQKLAARARDVVAAGYGALHPEVADALNMLAISSARAGEPERALAMFKEARAIIEMAYGGKHPRLAVAANNVGIALRKLGRLDEARLEFERAYAIWSEVLGAKHPRVVSALNNLGKLAAAQERWKDSDEAYGEALAVLEASLEPQSPRLIRPLLGQGEAALALGDKMRARALCERAAAIAGAEHPWASDIAACLKRSR